MDDFTKQITAEIAALESDRQPFDTLWQDLAVVCMPRKQVTRKTTLSRTPTTSKNSST